MATCRPPVTERAAAASSSTDPFSGATRPEAWPLVALCAREISDLQPTTEFDSRSRIVRRGKPVEFCLRRLGRFGHCERSSLVPLKLQLAAIGDPGLLAFRGLIVGG